MGSATFHGEPETTLLADEERDGERAGGNAAGEDDAEVSAEPGMAVTCPGATSWNRRSSSPCR